MSVGLSAIGAVLAALVMVDATRQDRGAAARLLRAFGGGGLLALALLALTVAAPAAAIIAACAGLPLVTAPLLPRALAAMEAQRTRRRALPGVARSRSATRRPGA